ncbi:MAG TPA: hypothetical protein VF389_04685, partial [Woeseiaceae bacterium]
MPGATAATFSRKYEIEDQVDPIIRAIILNRVQSPVIDLEQLSFAQVAGFITDGKQHLVVRDNRQVHTV